MGSPLPGVAAQVKLKSFAGKTPVSGATTCGGSDYQEMYITTALALQSDCGSSERTWTRPDMSPATIT